jgi:hypothetical protein
MNVEIWLKETSQSLKHPNTTNTYTKGPLYVVFVDKDNVYKYPLDNIWRIKESY